MDLWMLCSLWGGRERWCMVVRGGRFEYGFGAMLAGERDWICWVAWLQGGTWWYWIGAQGSFCSKTILPRDLMLTLTLSRSSIYPRFDKHCEIGLSIIWYRCCHVQGSHTWRLSYLWQENEQGNVYRGGLADDPRGIFNATMFVLVENAHWSSSLSNILQHPQCSSFRCCRTCYFRNSALCHFDISYLRTISHVRLSVWDCLNIRYPVLVPILSSGILFCVPNAFIWK